MLNRHQSREVAVQALFNLDFRENKPVPQDIYQYVLDEFYSKKQDNYSSQIFFGILKNIKKIDEIISSVATDLPFKKIALVDRNILRLGIFEMFFLDGIIPPRVSINESIELAKTFGGKNSFKFISGVLGTVYKNSELKKNDTGLKKTNNTDAPMIEKAGAVIFSIKNNILYFALIYDLFGYWTLPKGSLDNKNTTLQETARKKAQEELGIKVEVLDQVGEIIYNVQDENNQSIKNKVVYFLATTDHQPLILQKDNEGLVDARWFTLNELEALKKYDDLSEIINKSIKIINNKYL